jgi:hypothetical protein
LEENPYVVWNLYVIGKREYIFLFRWHQVLILSMETNLLYLGSKLVIINQNFHLMESILCLDSKSLSCKYSLRSNQLLIVIESNINCNCIGSLITWHWRQNFPLRKQATKFTEVKKSRLDSASHDHFFFIFYNQMDAWHLRYIHHQCYTIHPANSDIFWPGFRSGWD